MTVKEQLNSIRDCKIRIQNKQEELRQLEEISIEAQDHETEQLAIEVAATKQEIMEEWTKLVRKQREIIHLIEGVDDPVLYNILYQRYIQCKAWKDIARETGYSETHLYRLHKKATEMI